jgi:hypoxanthine-DNA glycosylase
MRGFKYSNPQIFKIMILEHHPFGSFIPPDIQYLVVGTFPGRQFSQRTVDENEADIHAFSYGGRNQFWRIMEKVYAVDLPTRNSKKALFQNYNIGLLDVIKACRRKKASNLDTDLVDIVWNKPEFDIILTENNIKNVFCTGKAVAQIFQKWYPEQPCVALPSPSPLYAAMRFEDKLNFYKKAFPEPFGSLSRF